jgi:hypothetical protein
LGWSFEKGKMFSSKTTCIQRHQDTWNPLCQLLYPKKTHCLEQNCNFQLLYGRRFGQQAHPKMSKTL